MTPKSYPPNTRWVKESTFSAWFLGTETWETHVLTLTLDGLERLMGKRDRRYESILDTGYGHGQSVRMLEQRFQPDNIIAWNQPLNQGEVIYLQLPTDTE